MADDYNLRAAKGQSFNLAYNTALKHDKEKDVKFIYSEFVRIYELSQNLQNATLEDVKAALK